VQYPTIHAASQVAFANVEGWVGDRIPLLCEFIRQDHEKHGVAGDVAEIGIHHGKLFFMLAHVAKPGERLIAIDLFQDQGRNIDNSGMGDRETFETHVDRHFSYLRPNLHVHACDSMAVLPADVANIFPGRVRVMSVDGGHTIQHVLNDLSLAQDILQQRGIVMLDDFLGPHWPGVTEGFFQFMARQNRRLAPFLYFQNKLFLTTYSDHQSVHAELRAYLDRTIGDEIHGGRWKFSTLCGYNFLAYG
jgi:hypothetical protein